VSAHGEQWGLSLELPRLAGFRLWNVELLNWGTFDGSIVSFPIEGQDAFVTGTVGAGKSTIVDALTTLFVPTNRIVYNKAAGASRNERRLETYLRGTYSSAADETGTRAKPVSLRTTKHVSAVLAHFRDEQDGVDAVFIHVYYFTAAGAIEKIFAVSTQPITLESLLEGAHSDPRTLQKLIRQRVTRCDSWRDYLLAVRRMLGLEHEQALDLWFQTVSMKQVENLTSFVRSHMLEPPDETRTKIDELVTHYEDLTAAAAAIDKAKAQLAILDPLMTSFADHERHARDGDNSTRIRDETLEPFYQRVEIVLVDTETAAAQGRLTSATATRDTLSRQRIAVDERIRTLERTIQESGGAALTELEGRIRIGQADVSSRQERRRLFEVRCADAGVEAAPDLDAFLTMRIEAQARHDEATEAAERRRPDYDAIADLHGKQRRVEEIGVAVTSLRSRRSNLDADLLTLRSRIAQATGVAEDDLPFVGELLQVRGSHREWEPAIQRLMRGFGMTLLVPEDVYAPVSEWVDRTNLRTRLTYQAVPAEVRAAGRPVAGTLPDALDVDPASAMAGWLGAEVMRRFRSIALAQSLAQFRDADQAITKQGQVKRTGRLHDKDDRFALGDQRRYVLGWDNQAKIAALEAEAHEMEGRISQLQKALGAAERQQRTSQKIINATDALLREYADFAQVDVAGALEELAALEGDRDRLLAGSSTLTELRAQKDREESALEGLRQKYDRAVGNAATAGQRVQDLQERRRGLPEQPPDLDEGDQVTLAGLHAQAEQKIAAVSLATLDRVRTATREAIQAQIDAAVKRAARARENAVRAMEQFKERYPQDTNDMDASMESAADFGTLHQRLVDDDLPQFEAEFRRQLSENTLREIAGFNQHLEERRIRIKDRVERINESLVRIDYTRDTYIALEPSPSPEPDLAAFRRDLRECIDGTLGGGESSYSRERFEQVKAIVERFKGRPTRAEEDRAWTSRVTDVRNWNTFAIVERNRAGEEVVAYYSDSEGKSGGEKEKLAYTVLAAALSYQFGLVPGDPRPQTFRFIALDEAFARGSDSSTRFALELFKTMGLQLLIVTPLQKKEVIAPYVQRVALIVKRPDSTSRSIFLRIEDYVARMDRARRFAPRGGEVDVNAS
jgi:uncharacterized protein YPO0396